MVSGSIIFWSGSIESIPSGYALCDGTNGTPDLRNKFVVGAGDTYIVGAAGGTVQHNHTASQASHFHNLATGGDIAAGTDITDVTNGVTPAITVDNADNLPPYYSLCYIMKL
jgi:hypothetical protein